MVVEGFFTGEDLERWRWSDSDNRFKAYLVTSATGQRSGFLDLPDAVHNC